MTSIQAAGEQGPAGDPEAAGWMAAVGDGLRAAGLDVRLRHSRAGSDMTAVARRQGGRETEVVVDDDGYVEIRYWNLPGATAVQVADVITRALDVVHRAPGPGW